METGTQYPSTRIAGAETDAHVMGLERDQLEDNVIDQIRTMASHEAFQDNYVFANSRTRSASTEDKSYE